jgi:hypothetical protein
MRIGTRSLCGMFAVLPVVGLALLTACAREDTQALFTRPELITHGRLAVLGLTPEQEQIFMAAYTKAFPGQAITFVERNRLYDILDEQDLLEGRLNEQTRARIKQIFGVEALIMCTYSDATTPTSGTKLRVRIVNSETGAIVGSVITHGGADFEYLSSSAVRSIKADLMGEMSRSLGDETDI